MLPTPAQGQRVRLGLDGSGFVRELQVLDQCRRVPWATAERYSRARMSSDYPILQFDPAREAVIEPARLIAPADVPEAAVLCSFTEVIERLCGEGRGKPIGRPGAEGMPFPMYEIDLDGRRLAVIFPGVGAPLAAMTLEDAIAHGCRKFAVCGAAGALVRELVAGHVVVPEVAVRDEGTSYHYVAPSIAIRADARAVAVTRLVLEERSVPYLLGKTWTTDAPYRETRARVEQRRRDGCVVVEMEAAALIAIAQFRHVPLAYLLYAGDSLAGRSGTTAAFGPTRSERPSSSWPPPPASVSEGMAYRTQDASRHEVVKTDHLVLERLRQRATAPMSQARITIARSAACPRFATYSAPAGGHGGAFQTGGLSATLQPRR